jgi:AraC-like DNA-binding protein
VSFENTKYAERMSQPSYNRYWQDAAYPGLRLQRFGGKYWDAIAYYPKKYQLRLLGEGKGQFIYKQKAYLVNKGDLFFIQPGQLHSGQPDSQAGWQVTCLIIQPDTFITFLNELGRDETLFFLDDTLLLPSDKKTLELKKCFSALIERVIMPSSDLETETLLFETFEALISIAQKPTHCVIEARKIQRAVKYIRNNFERKLTLEELADVSHLSKFHLLRTFKGELGMPPHAFQMQLRLNEARKRLLRGESSLEVALALGFADQAHFMNAFKRYTHLTPKKYQKQLSNIFQSFESSTH